MEPKWICNSLDNKDSRLVSVFRKSFTVKNNLKKAVLKISAHGLYEALINDKEVTENKFTPGLTSYYYRIQFQEYDITDFLNVGNNTWQTTVGDGWYRWNNNFGYRLALWGEITLIYENEVETVKTDESFDVTSGPLLTTDLMKGEYYDARIIPADWHKVTVEDFHTDSKLIETEGVPVREKEHFKGTIIKDNANQNVIDFGQNIAGYVKMKLFNTKPGQIIHLKHGEALDLNGVFSTANCDGGKQEFQEITYICKGAEVEEYKPKFTYFGFRYALLEGIEDGEFEAIAVYSDMEETGDFKCSSELINKLVENARWSQKSNFLDVAVDCPTREKNAWTGDAMIYCRTAAYFMNVYPFFEKWLKDQTIEQYESGKVGITFPSTSSVHNAEELKQVIQKDPHMALAGPTGNGNIGEDSVGWGDSSVWIPYQMYLMYGDKKIIENQYSTAKKWLDYSLSCMKETNPLYANKVWNKHNDGDYIYDTLFHYGEWNEPLPPSPEVIEFFKSGKSASDYVEFMAQFGKPEVATAYTKRSADNLAYMAKALGNKEDEKKYTEISQKIKDAYNRYLISDEGVIQEGHQAAYVRALALDMVYEDKKQLVINQLKKELEKADYHLNTGFLSTVYLLPTLCENGLIDEAFRILEQDTVPSWLHPITLGATTMLENWNGMDVFRDSFNHYSFGSVCQFLFEYVAGIRPCVDVPGFAEFELKPLYGGSLKWAEGSYKTKYGVIKSQWKMENGKFSYYCLVPDNCKAHLTLPDGNVKELRSGEHRFELSI